MWLAGFMMAEWILKHPEYFEEKNCLELGCGLGLVGLVAIQAAKPGSFTFSDHHPKVLELLRYNVEASLGENFVQNSVPTKIIELDWNDFDPSALPILPNLVLGSDISFDVDDQPKIVELLKKIFERNPAAKALICYTIRSDSVPLRLRECLEEANLNFQLKKLERPKLEEQLICIAASEQCSVELLEISL